MMGATLPLLDALGVPQTQKCRVPAAISSVVNFSVTDPTNNYAPYNIVTGAPFGGTDPAAGKAVCASGAAKLAFDIAWDSRDYTKLG